MIYNKIMFRVAICEDEKVVLNFETSLVRQWAEKRVEGGASKLELDTYVSAEQFLFESEDKATYDLLIFDIQMKNMNGMELAKKLRSRGCNSQLIFVTGVADYAIEGYEVGAVRYILKPLKQEVLFGLLDSVYCDCQKKTEDYFVFGQGSELERIPLDRIIYLEAQGHYVFLKAKDFERTWKAAFSEVAEGLSKSGPAGSFFCLRRGLLVNLAHVSRITRNECILDNEEVLPVARGAYKDLNEAFISYFKQL